MFLRLACEYIQVIINIFINNNITIFYTMHCAVSTNYMNWSVILLNFNSFYSSTPLADYIARDGFFYGWGRRKESSSEVE